MVRRKEEVTASPVLEIEITFKDNETLVLHMDEQEYNEMLDELTWCRRVKVECSTRHYPVMVDASDVKCVRVIDVIEGDEYGNNDEDQGPASTD
jgi:hypothetical protein